MPRHSSARGVTLARAARKSPSVAEQIVWNWPRSQRTGFKFRREHPVGPWRLDFYCEEAKLAVELDGDQHDPVADVHRDADLARYGIQVLRIPNARFFEIHASSCIDELETIIATCESRTHRPRRES